VTGAAVIPDPRRMRFGLCTDQNLPWPTLLERWRLYERLGFDSVWDCDHFNQPSRPTGPFYEGWTLLAALAARTERIRIGVLVSCNSFRHPALLAHEAMTVDHVSNGRLELGLGAGWFVPEHEQFGIDFPPPGELVGRFYEAVQIVDALLRHGSASFAGRYYRLKDAHLRPGPVQKPRPPLTLGAHRTRMLRICAEFADRWNSFGTVEEMRERNQILDEHCAALGRDPRSISRSFYGWASKMAEQGLPDPWTSVAAFEDVVSRYAEVGIHEFIIDQPRPEQFAVLERVAADLIPKLHGRRSP
jgi:alkanesulfonate monooxygenase SsuD/methylene tetrahydromethanopterin reductase-like flavin-dependent oxidoreductase (luciferase family)